MRRPITAALLAAAALATAGPPAAAAEYPAGFEKQTLISGLTRPTGVAWAPNGRAFVIEKDGVLKVAAPGASTATTVLDLRNRVNS